MGEESKTLFKRVAAKMANKTGQKYSETINLHQEETALRPSENKGHPPAGVFTKILSNICIGKN